MKKPGVFILFAVAVGMAMIRQPQWRPDTRQSVESTKALMNRLNAYHVEDTSEKAKADHIRQLVHEMPQTPRTP